MPMMSQMDASVGSVRRSVLLALAAGLSIAALVGIVAILTQSFDSTDLRLVGTSLGFSVFSALGAAGARAERSPGAPRGLGTATMAGATLGFVLLLVAIWVNHSAPAWRLFGTLAVATLAASHACLVLSARRAADTPTVGRLARVSVVAAAIDSALGVLAISGAIERIGAGYVQALAVLVIVMLLSTALPPILRRLQVGVPTDRAAPMMSLTNAAEYQSNASELLAIANELDGLARNPRSAAKQLGRHAANLRQIAQRLKTE
jgi:hypothetical protein